MSKLSTALKLLINAPHSRPGPLPAPSHIEGLYHKIYREALAKKLGRPPWLSIATATVMTMNSPDAMVALYTTASAIAERESVSTAELMREIGLKCIGFNGIPRTINMLNAFRASLPPSVLPALTQIPTRLPTPENIATINSRGRTLWNDIYHPLANKLEHKLHEAHPDLPVFIINSEYGALFTDPSERTTAMPPDAIVGRLTMSLVAIACLRAQQGVGPQVLSHVYGLRKAWEHGSWTWESHVGDEEGVRWLVSDEGCMWVLEKVDELVAALGQGEGSSFAPVQARL